MKNNSNFLFGLILIVVGGFWIAGSCGYIQLSYIHLLFRFWPALLIILGLNMIFQGNKAVMALSVLLLVGCIAYCTQHSELYLRDYNYMFNTNCVESGQGNCVVEDLYDLNGIEKATLKLELGAGDIDITASDSDQLRFGVPNRNMSRTVNTKNEEADIRFKNTGGLNLNGFGKDQAHNYYFELPQEILWRLNVDAGAADASLDLSKLNVEYIKIDAGASDCNLILGDNAAYVYVDVDTGVSSLIIQVKEGMGLRIKSDQVLSDDNYDAAGLYEVEGYYQTKNYDEATHQAEIKLDAAMSDVVVEFY